MARDVPVRAFNSVDFPTLGRPMMAMDVSYCSNSPWVLCRAPCVLVSVGDIPTAGTNPADWAQRFRAAAASRNGQDLPIVVKRNGQTTPLNGKVVLVPREQASLKEDPNASPKAARVRNGILKGTTGR